MFAVKTTIVKDDSPKDENSTATNFLKIQVNETKKVEESPIKAEPSGPADIPDEEMT